MTQDEIIEMARQAGYQHPDAVGQCEDFEYFDLETFAKLVAEKEREACALIVDKAYRDCKTIEETHYKYSPAPFNPAQFGLNMEIVSQSKYLSYTIRARGQA